MRSYLTEFIGTFFLVLTIGLTVIPGLAFAPLAIGATLMVMVYMGGHVSGAHYNPAISFAVFLRGKMKSGSELAGYVLSQLAGAIAAALVVRVLLGRTFAPAPGADATVTGAVIVEFLFTFALALVVLNSAASARTRDNSFYGLAIGFTIVAGAFAGGGISGGAYNPAVGIGPILVHSAFGDGSLGNLWIYLVGPLLGAAVGSIVFGLQERPEVLLHAEPGRDSSEK
jgi:aquaporin Z